MMVREMLAILFAFVMVGALLAAIHSMSKPPKPLHEMRWYELGDFFFLAPFLRRSRAVKKDEPKD